MLSVILLTTMVIVAIYAITGSWAGAALAGGTSGVATVVLYPVIFRARIDPDSSPVSQTAGSHTQRLGLKCSSGRKAQDSVSVAKGALMT